MCPPVIGFNTEVIDMKKKKPCVLKIGKEEYGKIKIEDAFRKALEPYFKNDDKKLSL